MIAKFFFYAAAGAAALVSANAASAAVLLDRLPGDGDAYVREEFIRKDGSIARPENAFTQVTFNQDVELTGFAIMTRGTVNVDSPVSFKIRKDVAGVPDASLLYNISGTIETRTTTVFPARLATMNFAPITLTAGTYFIGLGISPVGSNNQAGWSIYDEGTPVPLQYRFRGDDINIVDGPIITDGTLAFALYGNVLATSPAAVPEPATWAMMIGGLGLVGASMRRRATKVAFA